jgi:hypothetical protein
MTLNKFIAVALIVAGTASSAWAAEKEGNGGQRVAAEFAQSMAKVMEVLRYNFTSDAYCDNNPRRADLRPICRVNQDQLERIISSTRLLAVPEIKYQDPNTGQVISFIAQNFPSQSLIKISISQWDSMKCGLDRAEIAFHEYLGIMGLEADSYPISSVFRNWLVFHGDGPLRVGCDQSTPSCSERISDLITVLDGTCFKTFINTPADPKNEQDRQGRLAICMNNLVVNWRHGFGQTCGGSYAQTVCLTQCRPYSDETLLGFCREMCPRL